MRLFMNFNNVKPRGFHGCHPLHMSSGSRPSIYKSFGIQPQYISLLAVNPRYISFLAVNPYIQVFWLSTPIYKSSGYLIVGRYLGVTKSSFE